MLRATEAAALDVHAVCDVLLAGDGDGMGRSAALFRLGQPHFSRAAFSLAASLGMKAW